MGNIKAYKRVIIKSGPETLAVVDDLHKVVGKFYSDASVETQHTYPQIAEKMKDAMEQIRSNLSTRIFMATPEELRGRRV
jgi:hypothetical protein